MGTTTIRVSEETRRLLAEVAAEQGQTITSVAELAARKLFRDHFWDQWDEGWKRLRADPAAFAEYEAERAEWELAAREDDEHEDWSALDTPDRRSA